MLFTSVSMAARRCESDVWVKACNSDVANANIECLCICSLWAATLGVSCTLPSSKLVITCFLVLNQLLQLCRFHKLPGWDRHLGTAVAKWSDAAVAGCCWVALPRLKGRHELHLDCLSALT